MIERANQTIVGFYQKNKNFGFVVPDNQKINADVFIPQGKDMGAVTGHKVVVHLTDFGGERKNRKVLSRKSLVMSMIREPIFYQS